MAVCAFCYETIANTSSRCEYCGSNVVAPAQPGKAPVLSYSAPTLSAIEFTPSFLMNHEGRINRKHYILYSCILSFLPIIVNYLNAYAYFSIFPYQSKFPTLFLAVQILWGLHFVLVQLPLSYIAICLGVKRCHDIDKSGWFLLWGLIPIIGPLILSWVLLFKPGTAGSNQFGSDPLLR